MSPAMSPVSKSRINWVDSVKGLTILLVVLQHTTYGVAAAMPDMPGFFYAICKWAEPFRMPLFFLVAGLFAQKALQTPLRSFLDGKILHFVYFYVLWTVIQIGLKIALPHEGGAAVSLNDIAMAVVEPFGILWFIYCLALFFGVMRLTRAVPPLAVFVVALALFLIRPHTGWMIPDEFAHRFIFFVSGVYFARHVFTLASWAIAHARTAAALSLTALTAIAALVYGGLVQNHAVEIIASYSGAAAAIMLIAMLAARGLTAPLAYAGSRSLAIYLAFFIPMALSRTVLIKLGLTDADLVTLIGFVFAVASTLIAHRIALATPFKFFYERPDFLKLKQADHAPRAAMSQA
ncbi:MAG: acyltransferase family protein [Parvibaculum sp.]|nr:acyltransferase family protein [Parvibaculum sp.]